MNRDQLNVLRRCAGVPQDFSAEQPVEQVPVTEDVVPGMSQVLRGGKHKFYLVCDATKDSELGDVITEVDIKALANIIRGAGNTGTKEWELFPHDKQNEALNLARERLAKVGAEKVTEGLAGGVGSRMAASVPHPSQDEIAKALAEEDFEEIADDDFEPATNICPDCEGGEHPPAVGKCERCDGEGEIFEAAVRAAPGHPDDKTHTKKKGDGKNYKDCPDCNGGYTKDGKDCKKCEGNGKVYESKEEECEEMEEVSKCKCGCDPKRCECKSDCKCGCNAVKESAGYYTEVNPLTHDESEQPKNVDVSSQKETVWDEEEEPKDDYLLANDTTAIKVPAKVLSELKRVIDELTAEAKKVKLRDVESANYYEDTAKGFQIVYDFLKEKTVNGLQSAQTYSQKMMNIQRTLMPDSVWKFIVNGGTSRSLKSYLSPVKAPTLGKPFANVAITTLNKNTNTE